VSKCGEWIWFVTALLAFFVGLWAGRMLAPIPSRYAPTTITSPEGHQFYIGRDMSVTHTIPCPKCGEETEK
jgi:hypothetical protein